MTKVVNPSEERKNRIALVGLWRDREGLSYVELAKRYAKVYGKIHFTAIGAMVKYYEKHMKPEQKGGETKNESAY